MSGNGPQFFETMMGRKYYDGTMPKVAKALERIADALEGLPKAAEAPEAKPAISLASHNAAAPGTMRAQRYQQALAFEAIAAMFVDEKGEWRELSGADIIADISRVLRNAGFGGKER